MPLMEFLSAGILQLELWGNTVEQYLVAILVFLGSVLVLGAIKVFVIARISRRVEASQNQFDNAVVDVFKRLKPPFYVFVSFYGATRLLTLSGLPDQVLETVLLLWIAWEVVAGLQIFIDHIVQSRFSQAEDASRKAASGIIGGVSKILLWILAALFVLSNLGVNITSLVAGLGIGGLALALAAQKVLEDLFASLAIYFDRPFAPGDFIVVDDHKGTVQRIGIKTTRIKALEGEEVIIPNKDITSSRVENIKRMQDRRVEFKVGVTYDTPHGTLQEIPELVQQAIEGRDQVEYKRTNLVELGDSAMLFEIVYIIEDRNYELYMNIHEQILLAIIEKFEERGIEFAFPTQTIHLAQGEAKAIG